MSLTTTARPSAGRGDRGEILTHNTFEHTPFQPNPEIQIYGVLSGSTA